MSVLFSFSCNLEDSLSLVLCVCVCYKRKKRNKRWSKTLIYKFVNFGLQFSSNVVFF